MSDVICISVCQQHTYECVGHQSRDCVCIGVEAVSQSVCVSEYVECLGVCLCLWVCPQRGHVLSRVCVSPCLSPAAPPGSWLRPVGSDAPLTPPHPQHHLMSHAACQCCSEHAHAHTEPRASEASSRDPRPASHGQGSPAASSLHCRGGRGLADHVTRAAAGSAEGKGAPSPAGPAQAPPRLRSPFRCPPAQHPTPTTVAVNPGTPQAQPLCAAAPSGAKTPRCPWWISSVRPVPSRGWWAGGIR